ncbi:MAG: hypothetical protein HFG22_01745 [Lachnospiraceae bacterium]|nr:hypothetical protein [Lachnospiraceae bacterium]
MDMDVRGILGVKLDTGAQDALELLLVDRFAALTQAQLGQEKGEESRYKELEDLVMQHHPEGEQFLDWLADREDEGKEDFYLMGIRDGIRVTKCFAAI